MIVINKVTLTPEIVMVAGSVLISAEIIETVDIYKWIDLLGMTWGDLREMTWGDLYAGHE